MYNNWLSHSLAYIEVLEDILCVKFSTKDSFGKYLQSKVSAAVTSQVPEARILFSVSGQAV